MSPIFASFVTVASVLGGIVVLYFIVHSNVLLRRRVSKLEREQAVMGQGILPMFTAVRGVLIKQLTHYHTPELDALMAKIPDLTEAETARLFVMLAERTVVVDAQIGPEERDAARMLPMVMERARREAEADPKTLVRVQLISTSMEEQESR